MFDTIRKGISLMRTWTVQIGKELLPGQRCAASMECCQGWSFAGVETTQDGVSLGAQRLLYGASMICNLFIFLHWLIHITPCSLASLAATSSSGRTTNGRKLRNWEWINCGQKSKSWRRQLARLGCSVMKPRQSLRKHKRPWVNWKLQCQVHRRRSGHLDSHLPRVK